MGLMSEPPYLTPRAAAIFLSVSPAALERWRAQGKGPPYTRIGRLVRYSRVALADFMAAGEVRAW